MFRSLFGLIALAATVAAGIGGYIMSRRFVQRRLRFVDAVYSPLAPLLVGTACAVVAWPVAGLLPIVTTTAAIAFGLGTGFGTASGVRVLKRGNVR